MLSPETKYLSDLHENVDTAVLGCRDEKFPDFQMFCQASAVSGFFSLNKS